jgi:hypothetical protein
MCFTCFNEKGMPRFSTFSLNQIPPDGVIFSTCDKGHLSAFVVQAHQFELLSEIALRAIIDGYYRDSVASFAAALERLYEFYIQLVCYENGVEPSNFDTAWKHLKKQSERQLGAFVACYLMENGYAPLLLMQKAVKFRNMVIHQGLIPNKEEALEFAQAVSDCAIPLIKLIKSEKYKQALMNSDGVLIRERRKTASKKATNISVGTILSPLSLTSTDAEKPIRAHLTAREEMPDFAIAADAINALGKLVDHLSVDETKEVLDQLKQN